jgi:HSP20 family protein
MASETPSGAGNEQATSQASKGEAGERGAAAERSQQRGAGQSSSGLSRRSSSAPAFTGPKLWGASPFALMRRMMEDMDRLFDEYVPGRFAPPSERREVQPRGMPFLAMWEPQVDVVQREGKLIVRADLPGLQKDDVRIEITDEGLVLEGERRSEIEEEREGTYRAERSYGSFRRVIPLPEGIDAAGAQAHFENGVLEITFPVSEEQSRGKRIEIQEGKPSQKPPQMH